MNSKHRFGIAQKYLLLISAVLVIIGSFLPWEIAGDFISSWRFGIQVFPTFADNGGIGVVLLGVLIILFVSRVDSVAQSATKNILISAIFLCIISAYHIVGWLGRRIASHGIVGAPVIAIGLILVIIGSILALATALVMNSRASSNHV